MTPVFYNNLVPFGWRGWALRWFIIIKPQFKDDIGLELHEKIHIGQQKRIGTLRYFYKYFIRRDYNFRAYVEFEAFKYGSGYSNSRIQSILVDEYGVPEEIARRICS